MTTFLLGTNSVDRSAILCDYLVEHVEEGDRVVAVNSHRGGDETSARDTRDGNDALNVVETRLSAHCTVETHQYIRGNDPATDILEAADEEGADEIVIGVRKRNPTAKVVFGSTAQKILLNANRPVRVVPLEAV